MWKVGGPYFGFPSSLESISIAWHVKRDKTGVSRRPKKIVAIM
jgi:hypothetical protein